jgi:hypothetical protein
MRPTLLGLIAALTLTACGDQAHVPPREQAAREQTAIDTIPYDTLPPPVRPMEPAPDPR